MKISVITVAYNAEATIADTLASVRAQTWDDYEHIVIDGASTDGTARILAEHAHPKLRVVSEPDDGIYDAMNKGLRLASGDLIGFLNADDFYARIDALAILASAAERNRQVAAIGAGVALVDPQNLRRIRRYYASDDFRPWMLLFGYMPPHPGFYVRREAAAQVGEFDPDLRTGGDFEWMVRFFHVHKLSMRSTPETLVVFRLGGASSSGAQSLRTLSREDLASCLRWGIASNALAIRARYVIKARQYVRRPKDFPAVSTIAWMPR